MAKLNLTSSNLFEKNSDTFADVILPFPLYKAYTYKVPIDLISEIQIGKRAIVQFGKSKFYTAVIVNIHHQFNENYKIKSIIEVLDEKPIIFETQLKLWKWVAEYYCCSIGEVMAAALPAYMKLESETQVILNPNFNDEEAKLSDNEYFIIEALQIQNELSVREIQDIVNRKNIFPIIKSLYLKGAILLKEELIETYKPKKELFIKLNPDLDNKNKIEDIFLVLEKAPKQLDILLSYQVLTKENRDITKKELLQKSEANAQSLDSLLKKEILLSEEKVVDRIEVEKYKIKDFELKDFQYQALREIKEQFERQNVVLLHGITSSGKTHIYIKLIEEIIDQGKQVLYLVPEISLTAQLIQRLLGYFGNKIGIYHSRFNPSERYEIWHKTLEGKYSVVLGVRSALFLPFKDLGLIIVDEEHENTFKQKDPAPRYHARDTAIYMAQLYKTKTLLGTATPSFESYYNVKKAKYGIVRIDKRYSEVLPPEIILSDLKEEHRKKRMKSLLSSQMFDQIKQILDEDDQVILFQNRRGYAPYLECQLCGWVPKCKHCDISLTYHKFSRQLSCHYCGYKQNIPTKCSSCGHTTLLMKGFGTEKIEDEIQILFSDTGIIRMDLDTTRSKRAHQKIISAFENREAQILVGTQMITKGLDFANVKLVGILNADQMLSFPDFRSIERSYQLISQVGGRAGRREERGKVIIQTFNINHPIFEFIINNDFEGFYEKEIIERKEFNYPPVFKLILITLKTKDLDLTIEGGGYLTNKLKRHLGHRVLGPEFPPTIKLKNEFIIQILIKFERNNTFITKSKVIILEEISKFQFETKYRKVKVVVDVDPY